MEVLKGRVGAGLGWMVVCTADGFGRVWVARGHESSPSCTQLRGVCARHVVLKCPKRARWAAGHVEQRWAAEHAEQRWAAGHAQQRWAAEYAEQRWAAGHAQQVAAYPARRR
eukprot:360443-Chlamydomonas_euryale.AAC.4